MITSYDRGWPIYWDGRLWRYFDTHAQVTYRRPCVRCGRWPTREGYDACLGKLPGVKSACCGHGVVQKIKINLHSPKGYVIMGILREKMDAFYGSIEPYSYERTPQTIVYVFRRERARGLARLIGYADDIQGGGQYFVLDAGLSSGWKDCRYLVFDSIDESFPNFNTTPVDTISIQIYDDRRAKFTLRFKIALWQLEGRGVPDARAIKPFIPLTINPTKMERYKV